jgi:hypothetical protein
MPDPLEARVEPGLILLVFLGILCALFLTRTRRRMGLGSSGKLWITVIVGFVLIMLVAWVAQQK